MLKAEIRADLSLQPSAFSISPESSYHANNPEMQQLYFTLFCAKDKTYGIMPGVRNVGAAKPLKKAGMDPPSPRLRRTRNGRWRMAKA
jgi:hypothetical protein